VRRPAAELQVHTGTRSTNPKHPTICSPAAPSPPRL
jgi:hypothetical protein